jgi:DNA modification methylase
MTKVRVSDIADLKLDKRNANRGTERDSEMLDRSLADYGVGRSVLLDRDGNIIAGNKTVEAARRAGYKRVVVVPSDGSTLVAVQRSDLDINSKKARELAIADNRAGELNLDWDPEVLSELEVDLKEFWNEEELTELLSLPDTGGIEEAPEPQIDRKEELQKKWNTKRGQIWEMGKHRLMCGDSTSAEDIAKLLDGECYRTVVTSPPYFLERSYEKGFTPEQGKKLIADVAKAWFPHCKDGGYFFSNFAGIQGWEMAKPWVGIDRCEYPAPLFHWEAFRAAGWRLHAERIWVKPHAACLGLWVLSTNRPVFSWEYLWTWRKGTGKEKLGPSDLRCRGVWDTSKEPEPHRLKDLGHDASFHIALPTWAIEVHSSKRELVAEPFSGTGTTICAAERTGRRCCGMELDPGYAAVALERLAEMGLEPKLTASLLAVYEQ